MLAIAEPDKIDKWLATVERRRKEGSLPKPTAAEQPAICLFRQWSGIHRPTITQTPLKSAHIFQSILACCLSIRNFLPRCGPMPTAALKSMALPSDSLASLEISGPGVATHTICVLNRDIERIDIPNTGYPRRREQRLLRRPSSITRSSPALAIVGTVKDKESGQPLARRACFGLHRR